MEQGPPKAATTKEMWFALLQLFSLPAVNLFYDLLLRWMERFYIFELSCFYLLMKLQASFVKNQSRFVLYYLIRSAAVHPHSRLNEIYIVP